MNRFGEDAGPPGPLANLVAESLAIEAKEVEGEKAYLLTFNDPDEGYVNVLLNSSGIAQLCVFLTKAAVAGCDSEFLTVLMVMLTESREESVNRLFESGHAKDSLEN